MPSFIFRVFRALGSKLKDGVRRTPNEHDWIVMMVAGGCLQVSVAMSIYAMVELSTRQHIKDQYDKIMMITLPALATIHFCWTLVWFYICEYIAQGGPEDLHQLLRDQQQSAAMMSPATERSSPIGGPPSEVVCATDQPLLASHAEAQNSGGANRINATTRSRGRSGTGTKVQKEINARKEAVERESLLLLLWSTLCAVVQVVCLKSYTLPQLGQNSGFAIIALISFFAVAVAVDTLLWFGVSCSFQQNAKLEEFVDDKALLRSQILDNNNPSSMSFWVGVFEMLVADLQEHPLTRAVTNPGTLCALVQIIGALALFVIEIAQNGTAPSSASPMPPTSTSAADGDASQQVKQKQLGFGIIAIHAACVLSALIYASAIQSQLLTSQCKFVSLLQLEQQQRMDQSGMSEGAMAAAGGGNGAASAVMGTADVLEYRLMKYKTRLLRSLDKYLRALQPKPRLLGASMESLRWTVIMAAVVLINLLLLYDFVKQDDKSASNSTNV